MSVDTIADSLTYFDFELFRGIQSRELQDTSWMKPKYYPRASHVRLLINRLNHVSHWVCSMILWPDSAEHRGRNFAKLVYLAQVPLQAFSH